MFCGSRGQKQDEMERGEGYHGARGRNRGEKESNGEGDGCEGKGSGITDGDLLSLGVFPSRASDFDGSEVGPGSEGGVREGGRGRVSEG